MDPKRAKLSHQKQKPGNIIASLPNEIWLQVFQHLDVISVIHCRRVNRKWNELLRDESIRPTVAVLDEKQCRKYDGYTWCNPAAYRHPFYETILHRLTNNPLWKSVNHLILIGDYNFHQIATAEPHTGARPVSNSDIWKGFESFTRSIALEGSNLEFDEKTDCVRKSCRQLQTVEIRQMACSWGLICMFLGGFCDAGLSTTLQLTNVSFILDDLLWTFLPDVEVPITSVELQTSVRRRDCLGEALDLPANHRQGLVPGPLADIIRDYLQRLELVPLKDLEEKYRMLLNGRSSCRVRREVDRLFDRIHRFGPEIPNSIRMERYQGFFTKNKSIGKFHHYVLMYYTSPRNCYQLLEEEQGKNSRLP